MEFITGPPLQSLPPKVFLSYSHADRGFVEQLAHDLAANRVNVWWDEWEIKVGQSLIRKIEEGIESSSYLGIVLTPSSVSSAWVQEELTAGLVRQLEERRVFVLPILLEECERPVFLREKKYADFRNDCPAGLEQLLAALESPNIESHGRGDIGDYKHDYAFEWGTFDSRHGFRLQITSHSSKLDFAVSNLILVAANSTYSKRLDELQAAGFEWGPRAMLLMWAQKLSSQVDAVLLIEGDKEASSTFSLVDPERDVRLDLEVRARRLGQDPGNDLLYEWKSILDHAATRHLMGIRHAQSKEEIHRFDKWLAEHPF